MNYVNFLENQQNSVSYEQTCDKFELIENLFPIKYYNLGPYNLSMSEERDDIESLSTLSNHEII